MGRMKRIVYKTNFSENRLPAGFCKDKARIADIFRNFYFPGANNLNPAAESVLMDNYPPRLEYFCYSALSVFPAA